MDLTNEEEFKKLDPDGIGTALTLFPEQIKKTWADAVASKITITPFEYDSVLISGMGGSSNAGKILQSLVEKDFKKPFTVFNDYGLPGWVNEKTLVVANTYSGNTEETLSAVDEAKKRGSKLLGVTTGGKLAEMIKAGEVEGAVVSPGDTNPSGFPKSGLGASLGALAGALAKAGVLNISGNELNAALSELTEIRKTWNAKEIAEWLHGNLPVLFAARPILGPLNAGRNAMCEISRNYTQFYDFPEMNHVLVEAMAKPEFIKEKAKYLFFVSNLYHPRILTRYKVTENILKEQGLEFKDCPLKGSTVLAQALELPHYCAWAGYYLSMLDDADPGPEPWIIKLKQELSQPVH
jgi:glucose/mannose-6-phosphate isomerase